MGYLYMFQSGLVRQMSLSPALKRVNSKLKVSKIVATNYDAMVKMNKVTRAVKRKLAFIKKSKSIRASAKKVEVLEKALGRRKFTQRRKQRLPKRSEVLGIRKFAQRRKQKLPNIIKNLLKNSKRVSKKKDFCLCLNLNTLKFAL